MHGLPQDLCEYVYFYVSLQPTVCLVRGKSGKSGYKPEHKPVTVPAIVPVPALFARPGLLVLVQVVGRVKPWAGGRFPRDSPPPGAGFVLARSLCTGMFCIHVWAAAPIHQLPGMLRYLSCQHGSEGGAGGSCLSVSLPAVNFFPGHPRYQRLVPLSLVKPLGTKAAKKCAARGAELLQEALNGL